MKKQIKKDKKKSSKSKGSTKPSPVKKLIRRIRKSLPFKKLGSAQSKSDHSPLLSSLQEQERPAFGIPEAYGVDCLRLMVRDPWWLFAYWEVTPQTERSTLRLMEAQKAIAPRRVLRVFCQSRSDEWFDIEVGLFASNWYTDVGKPDELWVVELGFRASDGRFYRMLRSNSVRTPRYGISDEIDPDWQLPDEIFRKLFEAGGAGADSRSSFNLVKPESS